MTEQDVYDQEEYLNLYDSMEICEECESEMTWEDCWQCGGEGFRELYEEDPLWYEPNDTEQCDICEGKGGYYVCSNHKNHKE